MSWLIPRQVGAFSSISNRIRLTTTILIIDPQIKWATELHPPKWWACWAEQLTGPWIKLSKFSRIFLSSWMKIQQFWAFHPKCGEMWSKGLIENKFRVLAWCRQNWNPYRIFASLLWRMGCSYLIKTVILSAISWWRHQMETFSALLAICAGNSPVSGEFPAQRPVTRSFDVFFDLRLNERLSKHSRGWWLETPSCPL